MKKIGNLIFIIVIGVSLMVTFMGCSFGNKDNKSNSLTAEDVLEKITKNIDESSQMDIKSDFFDDNYGIDKSILKCYGVRVPIGDESASECAVFQVKNKKDIDKVEAGIKKRSKILKDIWSKYNTDQYELVKSSKVVTEGNYVLFVVSQNADKIEENFKEITK